MNLLEIYLKEIHEEKPYKAEWCNEFPGREFVEITATWECYGRVYKRTHICNTREWSKVKEDGFYMG